MSETKLKKPEQKFKVGESMKFRVLGVDEEKRKLILTAKNSLILSNLPAISSYAELRSLLSNSSSSTSDKKDANGNISQGVFTHGFVTSLKKYGVVVNFYNNVFGVIPIKEFKRDDGKLEDLSGVGKVVRVRIVYFDAKKQRIVLSQNEEHRKETKERPLRFPLVLKDLSGSNKPIVKVVVKDAGVVVDFHLDSTTVHDSEEFGKTDARKESLSAFIPLYHLSDFPSLARQFFDLVSADDANRVFERLLERVVVLKKNASEYADVCPGARDVALASVKPSLVDGILKNQFSLSLETATVGAVVKGFVTSVTSAGVSVWLSPRVRAFCHVSQLSDAFVSDPTKMLNRGESVRATVIGIDKEKGRVSLSFKASLFDDKKNNESVEALKTFFSEGKKLKSSSTGDISMSINVGSVMKGKIAVVKPFGIVVDIDGLKGVTGFVLHENSGGKEYTEGNDITAVVLDIDDKKKIVDLTLSEQIVKGRQNSSQESRMESQEETTATVELVKEGYAIVSFCSSSSRINNVKKSKKTRNLQHEPKEIISIGAEILNDRKRVLLPGSISKEKVKSEKYSNKKETSQTKAIDETKKKGNEMNAIRHFCAVLNPPSGNIGDVLSVTVLKRTPTHLLVRAGRERGRIHVSETEQWKKSLLNFEDQDNKVSKPKKKGKSKRKRDDAAAENDVMCEFDEEKYAPGSTLTAVVIGRVGLVRKQKSEDELAKVPLAILPPGAAVNDLELSLLTDDNAERSPLFSTLQKGESRMGVVSSTSSSSVNVELDYSLRGRIEALETCVGNRGGSLQEIYPVGKIVAVAVVSLSLSDESARLVLADRAKDGVSTAPSEIEEGSVVEACVKRVVDGIGAILTLQGGAMATMNICDVADIASHNPFESLSAGSFVGVRLVSKTPKGSFVASSRRSDLDSSEKRSGKKVKKVANSDEDEHAPLLLPSGTSSVGVGDKVWGYVKQTTTKGCFVWLSRSLVGRVTVSELSDRFLSNFESQFPPGKLVHARVLAVASDGKVDLSLRKSKLRFSKFFSLADCEEGVILRGKVKKIESFGLFINIISSDVTALCHISEIKEEGEEKIRNLSELFAVGDPVTGMVLRRDLEQRKLWLGLRPSYIEGKVPFNATEEDLSEEEDELSDEEVEDDVEKSEEEGSVVDASSDEDSVADEDTPLDEEVEDEDERNIDSSEADRKAATLFDDVGFEWEAEGNLEAEPTSTEHETSATGDDVDVVPKKKKKSLERISQQTEEEIEAIEKRLLTADEHPQTREDYERIIASHPEDSSNWINYAAFLLSQTETAAARSVIRRGLKEVPVGSQEALNLWNALLNLENQFGSSEDVKNTFAEGLAVSEPKIMYMKLLNIYENSGKDEAAEELLKFMCKKFRESCKVQYRRQVFFLRMKEPARAREALEKALQALPARKHLKASLRFAIAEYKEGSKERGRTLFEGLVSAFPKRTDLWSVYLDQEERGDDLQYIRRLYDRVTSLRFSTKKMKYFFKRFLAFEGQQGSLEDREKVKQKARAFVESKITTPK